MSAPCIHCGGLQDEGTPIWRGKWLLTPVGAYRDGYPIEISRAVSRTLYAIARAKGRPLTHRDLPNATAQTLANHVREIRKATGGHFPLRGIDGRTARGWAWDARS
ncbi:hypothetical protein [Novosphingobium guangzhouense]|uniref:Uncharacterized protein n=1 Tax=Novosphingobium guangzhouense TaxID=1850347 RepID=A0A2K2FYS5_9SPHN|nr:hypothetical protein [Novosphingobium guangzhouense]PNU03949.1 hypothetical protein A8V01_04830 [Novosphingobium guangzhouense]